MVRGAGVGGGGVVVRRRRTVLLLGRRFPLLQDIVGGVSLWTDDSSLW